MVIKLTSRLRRSVPKGGLAQQSAKGTRRTNRPRRPNKSRRINPLNRNHNLNPKRFGGRRRCKHLGLHLWDQQKHLKYEHDRGVCFKDLKQGALADR